MRCTSSETGTDYQKLRDSLENSSVSAPERNMMGGILDLLERNSKRRVEVNKRQTKSIALLLGLLPLVVSVVGCVVALFYQSLFEGFISAILEIIFLWFVYHRIDNMDGPLF